MLPSLLFLGLRSLLASAASDPLEDEEDGMVEDEPTGKPSGFPGFPDGKMPTAKELLGMLDSLDISDEEKESLRESIMKQASPSAPVTDDDEYSNMASSVFFSQFVVLVIMLSIIALIFGNF